MKFNNYVNISRSFIEKSVSNPRIRQFVLLFSVNIITLPLGIITSIILTRTLGSAGFGDYSFINNLFNLSVIFGSFGFFQAGNRALVLTDDKQKAREYYGTELIVLFCLYLVISILLYIFVLYDQNIQEKGLNDLIKLLIPFVWIYLLVRYFEVLFQADNKITLLAKSRLFPKILFFCLLLLIYYFPPQLNVNIILIIWFILFFTQIIVFIYILFKVKPSFLNLKTNFLSIWNFNKEYGLNVYVGSIFAVGLSQLTGILISYFGLSNAGVGFYSLAVSFSAPLAIIPNIIATTNYKRFSLQNEISKKLILATFLITIFSLCILFLIVPFFVNLFYGEEFNSVIRLTHIIAIGVAFYGFSDFINRFLGAHGNGIALRNSSFVVGLSLLVFNLTLIPKWGEVGAAFTYVITGIIYFLNMVWHYRRSILKQTS